MRVSDSSILAKPGRDVVIDHLYATLTKPLDRSHVDFEIIPTSSPARIVVHAREMSTEGEVGKYRGSRSFNYAKANLANIITQPLPYYGPYPLTFRELRLYMRGQYNFLMEEGEFRKPGDTAGLMDDSIIDSSLWNSPIIRLGVTNQSIRFTSTSYFDLLIIRTDIKGHLKTLITNERRANLALLMDMQSTQL